MVLPSKRLAEIAMRQSNLLPGGFGELSDEGMPMSQHGTLGAVLRVHHACDGGDCLLIHTFLGACVNRVPVDM